MKYLKYMLFTFFMCFIISTPVLAREELMHCEYTKVYVNTDRANHIRYRVTYFDDNSVTHEYVPTDSLNYKKGNNRHSQVGVFDNSGNRTGRMNDLKDNFTAAEMQKYYEKKTCPYIIFKSMNGSLADRSISPVDSSNVSNYSTGNERDIAVSVSSGVYFNKEASTNDNNPSGNASGSIACTYGVSYSNIKVKCNATNNSLTCSSDLSIVKNSLKVADFKSGNELVCPKSIGIAINSTSPVINDIMRYGGTDTMRLEDESKEGNGGTTLDPVTEPVNDYEKDSRYIAAKADANKYCDSTNMVYQDDVLCQEARDRMKAIREEYERASNPGDKFDGFCSGAVQGVFTTLGWVFFVLKILIPIILIIFGIIDFSKAIVASKEDEIRKATKSMIIRAIAGVVVFFVPSLLGFVVSLIDHNDIYKGTFWDCTKCMLEPENGTCSGLGGN